MLMEASDREWIKEIESAVQSLRAKNEELEMALTNQEETIRELEKGIVTLKLQVQGLIDKLSSPSCVSSVSDTVSDCPFS